MPLKGLRLNCRERFVRFVRFAGLDLSNLLNFVIKKNGRWTDRPTNGWTDGRTERPSFRDAWTHVKMALLYNKVKMQCVSKVFTLTQFKNTVSVNFNMYVGFDNFVIDQT